MGVASSSLSFFNSWLAECKSDNPLPDDTARCTLFPFFVAVVPLVGLLPFLPLEELE
jgi:hypothetical protein